ncbi:MAG: tRNA preQ1(34) S-adenosylmethionine ribosyltransferase-isomerase QueA [Candidatus Marinimicrobia bacterium]|nr:tRNA preQ1(34) S-adenosylmethionine ribosyltransferase-isomerase QueA [Candidatus Neomarinimicrobiota bacterium]
MTLSDFDYELPDELIAQNPTPKRDGSKLLLLDAQSGEVQHSKFSSLVNALNPGDLLILNNTKVFPSRLFARKDKTDTEIELFLLRELGNNLWETLVKPARKVRVGNKLVIGDKITCDVVDNTVSGGRVVRFDNNEGDFYSILDEVGQWPLPPYIDREANAADRDRYQTVYAKYRGAVAAPTAGLHFTDALLNKIKAKGIEIQYVTLHVGLGTFRPVNVEDITKHQMDAEYFNVPEETVSAIKKAKSEGRRVIGVGTTVVRALESAVMYPRELEPGDGWTNKFIYPPYIFRVVDGIVTNFHQPKSTLLMLVSAFSSKEKILKAYKIAVENKYRFFSYGDAMFIS